MRNSCKIGKRRTAEQIYFLNDKEDAMKHTVVLSNGETVPALGQGTWYLGDSAETRSREIDALRAGIEAGMTLLELWQRALGDTCRRGDSSL